jgi:thiamine biosynthesis lipoprotein
MIRDTFEAMGTTVAVHTLDGDADRVRLMFDRYERRFSRFLADSELSRINADPRPRVGVSTDLADVLNTAAELRERTAGLVDIGMGRAIGAWGYDATFSDIADKAIAPDAQNRPSWSIEGCTLRRGSDTAIDLGGIAKGWTCDRAVESGAAVIASAGGDMRSSDPSLVVEVMDSDDRIAAEVEVGIGALATSSTTRRTWHVAGSKVHHIIDPRTMSPATTPVRSATVVADTAAEAEAGAKAVLLMGVDGLAWAADQHWIRHAVAIWHDGSVFGTALRRAS